jgi:hypothetical protein
LLIGAKSPIYWENQLVAGKNQQVAGKTSNMLAKPELLPATCRFGCWFRFRLLVKGF